MYYNQDKSKVKWELRKYMLHLWWKVRLEQKC